MASFNSSESDGVSKVGIGDGIGESNTCDVYKSNNFGDNLLDDLDSYWEDINVRLTISRMVSDSIIKGMVSAISQEATAKITAKELEVVNSKGILQCHHFRDSVYEPLRNHDELQKYHTESLNVLNQDVEEQLQRLEKYIANAKEPNFMEIFSTPEIIQFDENIEENLMIKNDFVEAFYCLKDSLKTMCQQVDIIACSHESFVKEWKVELDIHKEVETMVFCAVVQDIRCTFEKKLWDVNNVLALIENLNEISTLRDELHSFYKYFVGLENGNFFPHGSIEADHFHRKFSSNHGLSSTQIFDANGKCEESKNNMSENLPCRLNHMSTEELYQHFRTVITEMKREHESAVQVMTEENFTLKRELLKERELVKERGPSAAIKKDKEFEVIKKKISEVIGKVDDIVFENEKLSEFCNHSKETLDNLLCENYQLKDLLSKQKRELQSLSMKASDAADKQLHHSWAEKKLVGDLKLALQDQHIEESISKEVFKCMLKEMAALINFSCEDLDLKSMIMQDIIGTIYEEVFHSVDVASKLDSDGNSVLQSSIMQQMYLIVFQEVLKDMSMKFNELKDNRLKEDEGLSFFQRKLSEIENELAIKLEENNKLKNNILVLENSVEEKKRLLVEQTTLYETEKAELSKELNNIACLRMRQEALISERNEEILLLKDKLGGSQKKLDFYMFEIDRLGEALELSKLELRKSDEEKTSIRSILEKEQCYLASIKVKNSEHSKHMESLCDVIQDLSKSFADFELTVKESIGWNSVRLDNLAFQLNSLVPKVNVIRRTGSLNKERLEKKCLDLQKAEAEVDLLGDEVDNLLSLLEKIYVALDHYSPILQHYPGIIEIIKLVKRELGGVAVKAGDDADA